MSNQPLGVTRIADHLHVNVWQVRRILNQPGGLPAVKETGRGRVGRGGAWVVSLDDYLDWLHIPASARAGLSPLRLPTIYRLFSVSKIRGFTATRARQTLIELQLPWTTLGHEIFIHQSTRDALERALTPAKDPT